MRRKKVSGTFSETPTEKVSGTFSDTSAGGDHGPEEVPDTFSPLLVIEDLGIEFATRQGPVRAVDGLSLTIGVGETVGLVGESGCGKSATALAVLGLLASNGRVTAGSIRFAGRDLLAMPADQRRRLRGDAIGFVSQDPLAALNPVHPIGAQVAEVLRLHRPVTRRQAWSGAVEALAEVGLPEPARRARDFPHQLSGGQRQRVMIAMAMVCRPQLLVADEPTTALDVSVQAQILDLMRRLQAEHTMAIWLITHDLGVVAEMARRVTVMRDGRQVEEAAVEDLYRQPKEAYTRQLLAAVPRLDQRRERLTLAVEQADG